MSLEKKSETDVALESKTRFNGFHTDAPNALNDVNERINQEIENRENGDNRITETLNQDIEELGNELNDLTARVTALEQKVNGGAA